MSYDLLGWLGAVGAELTDPEHRLLFRLCWHANQETGQIHPSIETLAEATGWHPRTVMRHVKALEEKAFIEVSRERWPNGTQKVNRYIVCADITYRMPGDREVRVKAKMPAEKPGDTAVTWMDQPGDTAVIGRVTMVSPNEEGRVKKEESPLSYGKDTPTAEKVGETDLFGSGNLPALIEPTIELHTLVVQGWNEMVKRHPGMTPICTLNDSRRKKIYARAKDGREVIADPWALWQEIFRRIEANTYLCGEDPPGKNYTEPFALNVDFVLRPSEFSKILDGGYRANRSAHTHDPATNRRFGPAEQAGRAAFARIRDAGHERGNGNDAGGGSSANDRGDAAPRRPRSMFDRLGTEPSR